MDLDVVLKLGFFIIVILVSAISQFLKERPKKQPQQQQLPQRPDHEGRQLPPRPQANQQANQQAQPVPQQPQAGALEAEIEDFLRQVTGQKPKATSPPPEPIAAEPVYAEPEIIEAEPVSLSGFGRESVAEHVQHHIREGGIDSQGDRLATGIEQRDEKMDSHLHDVFDHNLGTLHDRKPVEPAQKVSRRSSAVGMNPDEILATFKSPEGIRKAIIVNEILTPKSIDW